MSIHSGLDMSAVDESGLIRVVATNHDTSTIMIERDYSRHIGDHSDQLARRALLDTGLPGTPPSKVVPINAGR